MSLQGHFGPITFMLTKSNFYQVLDARCKQNKNVEKIYRYDR